MAISKEKKNEIIAQYARHEGDTGSVEVQVAVLTWEILSWDWEIWLTNRS